MEAKNIILSPHYDDAVLSLGGLLAMEGAKTLVATLFAGVPTKPIIRPWDVKSGFVNSTTAMAARKVENQVSLKSFGVSEEGIKDLGLRDQQYRSYFNRGKSEKELEQAVEKIVLDLIPADRMVNVYAPGLEGTHVDHLIVKRAILAIAASKKRALANFFLYQDLPYAADEYLGDPEGIKVQKWGLPITEKDMQRKIAGIEMYRSQIRPLGSPAERIKKLASQQAKEMKLEAPYCEIVYRLV